MPVRRLTNFDIEIAMIRKLFLVPVAALFLLAGQVAASESIVRVSQSLSQVKAYAGGYFMVKIRIERRNLDSFFLIEQEIPNGMEAYGVESQGATFSYENGKVKYTWLRIPKEEEIQVMYKVKVPFEMRGKQVFEGSYYYIQNEEKEQFKLPPISIEVVEHIPASDSLAEKTLMSVINDDESKPAYVDEEREQLEFKVQILSSTCKLNKDSIRTAYKIKDKVQEENYNGLYKYTVGSFKTYEQARDYKNKLNFQKYIPFVIAYNRGARVTIGEAMQLAAKRRAPARKN